MLWLLTVLFWWHSATNNQQIYLDVRPETGPMISANQDELLTITYRQLRAIGNYVGFEVWFNPDDNVVSVRAPEIEEEFRFDTSLRPLVRDEFAFLRERHLYGEWVGAVGEQIFGYQFLSSEEYGPFTVVEIFGILEDDEGFHDVSRMGFYEILEDGRLRMDFRTRLVQATDELYLINEIEYWEISMNEVFITISRGSLSISMTRLDVPVQRMR